MSLDPVAKEVWCEALRSGEFKQGTGRLSRDGRYCCLGVARKVFPWLETDGGGKYLDHAGAEELLGLTFEQQDKLAELNDRGKSFAEIADHIEREL